MVMHKVRVEPILRPRVSPEVALGLAGIQREFLLQSNNPPGGDLYIRAFAKAALADLETSDMPQNGNASEAGRFWQALARMVEARPDIKPSYAVNLSLRALQKQLLRRSSVGTGQYPRRFAQSQVWHRAIRGILSNPDEYDEFVDDLLHRETQSNVPERYKALMILLRVLQNRGVERPSVADIGCSQMIGLKKLGVQEQNSQKDERGRDLSISPFEPVDSPFDQEFATQYNRFLRQPLTLGPSIGVDISPIDEDSKEWAFSNLYPRELAQQSVWERHQTLEALQPESEIHFFQGNFADLDHDVFQQEMNRFDITRFHLGFFSTVMYQRTPDERDNMTEALERYIDRRSGLIVIQDFVQIPPGRLINKPSELDFFGNWFEEEYRYRLLVKDMAEPGIGFQEVFRFSDGRCAKVEPVLGSTALKATLTGLGLPMIPG